MASALTAVIGFWLNLDAELELEAPQGYRPSPRVSARIRTLRPRLSALLGDQTGVIGHEHVPVGSRALAWCPTPSAVAAIARHGLIVPPHPPLAVLQRVNHRAFCAALGQTLDGAMQVHDMATLHECVRGQTPTGDWVLKRPFGFAGRERRRAIAGVLDDSTAGFARLTFERGQSLQVEPWVPRELDVSLHGFVSRAGQVRIAVPVTQRCDAMGRFEHKGVDARDLLDAAFCSALEDEARRVADALFDASYFGPFGIDAYSYRDIDGTLRFNPRSEINARFTMGFRWPEGVDPARVAAG